MRVCVRVRVNEENSSSSKASSGVCKKLCARRPPDPQTCPPVVSGSVFQPRGGSSQWPLGDDAHAQWNLSPSRRLHVIWRSVSQATSDAIAVRLPFSVTMTPATLSAAVTSVVVNSATVGRATAPLASCRYSCSCRRATSARRSCRLRGTSAPRSSSDGTPSVGGGLYVRAALPTAAASLPRSSALAAIAASGLWLFHSGSTASHACHVVAVAAEPEAAAAAAGRPGGQIRSRCLGREGDVGVRERWGPGRGRNGRWTQL